MQLFSLSNIYQAIVEDRRRSALYFFLSFAILLIVWTLLVGFGLLEAPAWLRRYTNIADTRPTPRNAYDIALPAARNWQTDAALAFLESGVAGETGRSDLWRVGFISRAKPGVALVVSVKDYAVVSTGEMPYVGLGADFPADILSEEEAIARVRQLKGYESTPILKVEAVYGPAGKVWYWGVHTAKGVVSIEAQKK